MEPNCTNDVEKRKQELNNISFTNLSHIDVCATKMPLLLILQWYNIANRPTWDYPTISYNKRLVELEYYLEGHPYTSSDQ